MTTARITKLFLYSFFISIGVLLSVNFTLAVDSVIRTTPGDLNLTTTPGTGGGVLLNSRQTGIGLFVNTSNNVGIGTTGPGNALHIRYTENANYDPSSLFQGGLRIDNYGDYNTYPNLFSGITFVAASNSAGIARIGAVREGGGRAGLAFLTRQPDGSVNERMRIDNVGNVGIGTTTPGQKLSVVGTIESTSGGFKFPDGTVQTSSSSGSATMNAANVSSGAFGSNTGGGNYSFPGALQLTDGKRIGFNTQQWAIGYNTYTPSGASMLSSTTPGIQLGVYGLDDAQGFQIIKYNNNQVAFEVSGTGNAYIPGKLGIGTASPTYKLDVIGNSAPTLRIKTTGISDYPTLRLESSNGSGALQRIWDLIAGSNTNDALRIIDQTAGATRLAIDPSGNVAIGTISSGSKLHVFGGRTTLESANGDAGLLSLQTDSTTAGNFPGLNFTAGSSGTMTVPSVIAQQSFALINVGSQEVARTDVYSTGSSGGTFDGNLRFFTQNGGVPGVVERVRIASNGNVGIGTTNPTFLLHLKSSLSTTNAGVKFENDANTYGSIRLARTGDSFYGNSIVLEHGSAPRPSIEIDPTGKVGINTDANGPTTELDLNGALAVRGVSAPAVAPSSQGRIYYDSTTNKFKVSENGGAYADMVAAGSGTQYITTERATSSNSSAPYPPAFCPTGWAVVESWNWTHRVDTSSAGSVYSLYHTGTLCSK